MLHIIKAQVIDSGVYECLAKNDAGEATAFFDVFVLVAPLIEGPSFRTMEAVSNQTIQIKCEISGIPIPEVDWYLDGQEIFSDYNSAQILHNGTTLQISNVDLEKHEGRYTCVARNKIGKAEADIFLEIIGNFFAKNIILIFSEIPSIKTEFIKIRIVKGGEERLKCEINGIPTPTVKWLHNNVLLNNTNQRISIGIGNEVYGSGQDPVDSNIAVTHYLNLRNVQNEDNGRYTCLATNRAGENRQNIDLHVLGFIFYFFFNFSSTNYYGRGAFIT